jgi:hypothetical protein
LRLSHFVSIAFAIFSFSPVELGQLETIRKGVFTIGKGLVIIFDGVSIFVAAFFLFLSKSFFFFASCHQIPFLVSSRLKVSPKASHQASKERVKIRGAVLVAMFIGPRARHSWIELNQERTALFRKHSLVYSLAPQPPAQSTC